MYRFFTLSIFMLLTFAGIAQDITQTVRGKVVDQQSEMPLPGVNVILIDSTQNKGTTTDAQGYYELAGVPAGRISLQFSFIGYERSIVRNVELTGSKELVLNIKLRERAQELDAAVVDGSSKDGATRNEMLEGSIVNFPSSSSKSTRAPVTRSTLLKV